MSAHQRGELGDVGVPGPLGAQGQEPGGGPGPQRVDWLGILDKWATGGPAPEEVTANFVQGGGGRKLCAWPKEAVFKGTGDGRSSDQFECK